MNRSISTYSPTSLTITNSCAILRSTFTSKAQRELLAESINYRSSFSDEGNASGFSDSKAQRECFAEHYDFSATNTSIRDEETGFGYFGARYMGHELMTMWLSVDPMADKYPSMSPYAYCALNPTRLVDLDGREYVENNPWYRSDDGEMIYLTHTEKQLVSNGKTYHFDGLTATYDNTYYGLFGNRYVASSEQGRFAKDADQVFINHALGRIRAKHEYTNEKKTKMTSIPDNINRMYGIPTTSENVVDKPWTYAGAKVRVYRNKDKSGYEKESMSDILKPKQFDVNSSLNSNISGYGLRIGNSALIYFDNFQDAIRFYQQFFCIFPKSK